MLNLVLETRAVFFVSFQQRSVKRKSRVGFLLGDVALDEKLLFDLLGSSCDLRSSLNYGSLKITKAAFSAPPARKTHTLVSRTTGWLSKRA